MSAARKAKAAKAAKATAQKAPEAAPVEAEGAEPTIHFLVVDDDNESRATVAEYLKSLGHVKISQARDGSEAVRLLEKDESIGFIISDWDMPLMNGLTLLQRVKFDPARAHLPFMIITSPVSQETEKVVLAAENLVDAYLIKPFRANALQEKIERVLAKPVRGPQKQAVVVDDDPDARETIIDYLKNIGFRDIVSFPDGRTALTYLSEDPAKVGIIVSDWEMPELSGLELLKACKVNSALGEVPFIMVTSQSSLERMKIMQAAKAKVDQYLLKPFTLDEIRLRVGQVLDRARARGEVTTLSSEGDEHLEHGRFRSAQLRFEDALKLDPDFEPALIGLGDALIKTKGIEAAVPHYRRAIEMNPVNPRAYLKLSSAYEQLNWFDKAIALLQTANQQVGFNADLHYLLAKLYNKRNMHDLARTECQKALDIQPDHPEARLLLESLR